ncbi:hypothetical protein CPB85DRAFT_1226325 [Mucidula mucida]|nr:hypothetical protein CPB85DRAFT_1226325 [Mucidula mucida]
MPLVFPSPGMQVLSSFIYFAGISVISHCVSRRMASEELSSWNALKEIPWPRLCILLIFLDSWAFLFSSGIITFGVGLESNPTTCAVAIYICVFFYATSKCLIYCFLIEKVHVVWSPTAGVRRRHSRIYMICAVTVALYVVVIVTMIIGKVTFFRGHDGACIIGLKPYSTIMLLSYDMYINVFLTSLFLWPLLRCNMNPRVRNVALRTLIAASVALTTSTVNMVVLTLMKGHQLGWVCLGSCGADVIFNALALFWVTRSGDVRVQNQGCPQAAADREARRPIDIDIRAANAGVSLDRSVLPALASPKSGRTASTDSFRNSIYDYLPLTPSKVYFGTLSPPSEQFEDSMLPNNHRQSAAFRLMNHAPMRPHLKSSIRRFTSFRYA